MIPKLTSSGKNLLLRALTGESITFTKIQLGNGPAQDALAASGLINPILTIELSKISVGQEYATLSASFTNSSVTSGFHITEAGFYAQDPADETKEILYAIGNEDESTADYVPDKNNRILEMQFDAIIFIGDAENVSAAISSSLVYASKEEFDSHTSDKNNPHAVTKKQVGLGNVPNVATNDQTPTFTEASTLATINSGEKVSTIFGKIKLAITNLINHINNKSNPHGCTASQVGAAAKSHTHSATDINSGVLSPLRGGTGVQIKGDFFKNVQNAVVDYNEYLGSGTKDRFINLGYTPRLVFVSAADGLYKVDSNGNIFCTGGVAILYDNAAVQGTKFMDLGGTTGYIVRISENGFYVTTDDSYGAHSNDYGVSYHYAIFK